MDETTDAEPAARAGSVARLVAGVADVAVALFAREGASTPTLDLALGALTLGARRIDALVGTTSARLEVVGDRAASTPVVGSVVRSVRERRTALTAAGAAERVVGRDSLGALVRTAVDRVDIGAIVDAIDINSIVERIDLDVIIDHLNVQAVIERVDIAAVVERIDVDDLIARTELGAIIAQSTSGMASRALDAVRSQTVGIDDFSDRWVNRVLRRRSAPEAPSLLVQPPPPEPTA